MKRFLFQLSICIIGFMAHFLYESLDLYRALSSLGGAPLGDYITTYTDRFEFLNGLTVGLLLSFFAYVISKYITTKNIEGILRGCIIPAVLFIVPAFFLGCFGPFFSFYVKKIGT